MAAFHPKPTLGTETKRRILSVRRGSHLREKQTKGFKVIFVNGYKASLPKSPKVLLIFEQQQKGAVGGYAMGRSPGRGPSLLGLFL